MLTLRNCTFAGSVEIRFGTGGFQPMVLVEDSHFVGAVLLKGGVCRNGTIQLLRNGMMAGASLMQMTHSQCALTFHSNVISARSTWAGVHCLLSSLQDSTHTWINNTILSQDGDAFYYQANCPIGANSSLVMSMNTLTASAGSYSPGTSGLGASPDTAGLRVDGVARGRFLMDATNRVLFGGFYLIFTETAVGSIVQLHKSSVSSATISGAAFQSGLIDFRRTTFGSGGIYMRFTRGNVTKSSIVLQDCAVMAGGLTFTALSLFDASLAMRNTRIDNGIVSLAFNMLHGVIMVENCTSAQSDWSLNLVTAVRSSFSMRTTTTGPLVFGNAGPSAFLQCGIAFTNTSHVQMTLGEVTFDESRFVMTGAVVQSAAEAFSIFLRGNIVRNHAVMRFENCTIGSTSPTGTALMFDGNTQVTSGSSIQITESKLSTVSGQNALQIYCAVSNDGAFAYESSNRILSGNVAISGTTVLTKLRLHITYSNVASISLVAGGFSDSSILVSNLVNPASLAFIVIGTIGNSTVSVVNQVFSSDVSINTGTWNNSVLSFSGGGFLLAAAITARLVSSTLCIRRVAAASSWNFNVGATQGSTISISSTQIGASSALAGSLVDSRVNISESSFADFTIRGGPHTRATLHVHRSSFVSTQANAPAFVLSGVSLSGASIHTWVGNTFTAQAADVFSYSANSVIGEGSSLLLSANTMQAAEESYDACRVEGVGAGRFFMDGLNRITSGGFRLIFVAPAVGSVVALQNSRVTAMSITGLSFTNGIVWFKNTTFSGAVLLLFGNRNNVTSSTILFADCVFSTSAAAMQYTAQYTVSSSFGFLRTAMQASPRVTSSFDNSALIIKACTSPTDVVWTVVPQQTFSQSALYVDGLIAGQLSITGNGNTRTFTESSVQISNVVSSVRITQIAFTASTVDAAFVNATSDSESPIWISACTLNDKSVMRWNHCSASTTTPTDSAFYFTTNVGSQSGVRIENSTFTSNAGYPGLQVASGKFQSGSVFYSSNVTSVGPADTPTVAASPPMFIATGSADRAQLAALTLFKTMASPQLPVNAAPIDLPSTCGSPTTLVQS